MRNLVLTIMISASSAVFAVGDYQAGEEKSLVCAACHGDKGVSTNPEWPNIAGQHLPYLIKQLNDYKKGELRQAPTMQQILANISEQEMQDIALFYSMQPIAEGVTPKKYLDRGEQIYRGGDFDKHISACIACHGPDGKGNSQAGFPVVSGQHAAYTVLQLQAFKDGTRRNDLFAIMRDISKRMDNSDMEAVAHYMSGLH